MIALRRAVPLTLLPLTIVAGILANSPWLRAYPSGIMAVPLFGAVLLSVLAPVVVYGIGVRRLWFAALVDLALFVFYELLVTLREPAGFGDLYDGLVHGPAKVLSYALPLVTPRTLLVAPVALCWVGGAIVGECLARGWRTVVPYLTLVVVFALSYAGSVRGVSSADDGRTYDTLLAAALLVALLLMRAVAAWVRQDESAEATQPGGLLPLRGLGIGCVVALVVGLGAAGIAQSSAFDGPPHTPSRVPPVHRDDPLTPLSFISGIRPADTAAKGRPVFTFTTDRAGSNYVPIADVDYYDGDGWSFNRTFRPSGGVLPSDADPSLRPPRPRLTQQYTIADGALTGTPWMPYEYRPTGVSGVAVDVDTVSGMVVPTRSLRAGQSYTVRSAVAKTPFARLARTDVPQGYTAANLQLPPGSVKSSLVDLVQALALETGVQQNAAIPFLQAVARDFQTNSGLAGGPAPRTTPAPATSTTSLPKTPAPALGSTPHDAQRAGGTSFADVLASIRQFRSATPEQYATLMALIARQVGVPARVATGFRVDPRRAASSSLPAGRYEVTTAQAWTWVEIPIAGLGWVVLDPSPSAYSGERTPPSAGTTPSPTPTPSPTRNAQITQAPNGHAPGKRSTIDDSRPASGAPVLLIVVLCLLAVAVLVAALLLLRKRWRASRRRHGSPRERLLGAWRETLDVLEEAGLPALRAATGREVAAATEARFGAEPARAVRQLGDAANLAIFHPGGDVSEADAEAAWRSVAVLSRMVRRRLNRRERLRASVRYHRPESDRPSAGPESWSEIHGYPIGDTLRHRRIHR